MMAIENMIRCAKNKQQRETKIQSLQIREIVQEIRAMLDEKVNTFLFDNI